MRSRATPPIVRAGCCRSSKQDLPADTRPRDAIDAAYAFARGGRRTGALRQSAWAAYRAAQEAASPAAVDAARAASHAAGAAYLHPMASAHQVKHILGAAAHAARAEELASGEDPRVTAGTLEWARHHAPAAVTAVLGRCPPHLPEAGAWESSFAISTPLSAPEVDNLHGPVAPVRGRRTIPAAGRQRRHSPPVSRRGCDASMVRCSGRRAAAR